MALQVKETTFTGGGSSSRSADGSRKAKRTFIVRYDADTPPASFAAIETADDGVTAIPAEDEALAGDTSRWVTNKSVKPKDQTGLVFDVDVDYDNGDENTVGGDDPLTVPVDYDWDFSASSRPYFKDLTTPTAKFVASSAGEPFENLLDREAGEIVVTVTDNIAAVAWDPVLAATYMSDPSTAKNDGAMTIDGIAIAAGQARFAGVRCSGVKTSNAIDYRTRVIILKLRANWDDIVEDRGLHEKDGTTGKVKEIIKGTPPVKPDKPWPLDGAGAAKPNASDAPAELTFKPYPSKPFAPWGIT